MGPSCLTCGIGLGLPAMGSGQVFHDAVVSPVRAIFPPAHRNTQALASGHELHPCPIELGPGALDLSLEGAHRIRHAPGLGRKLPLLRAVRRCAVEGLADSIERVPQLRSPIRDPGVAGKGTAEPGKQCIEWCGLGSGRSRARFQTGENAVAIIRKSDDAYPGRRRLPRVCIGYGDSDRNVAVRFTCRERCRGQYKATGAAQGNRTESGCE